MNKNLSYVLVVIVSFSSVSFADMVYTTCTKWAQEGWDNYPCDLDGKAYVVGKAICTTIDTRRNGDANTGHGPKPIEIFCAFKKRDNVNDCVNDFLPDTSACYDEYMKSNSSEKKKVVPSKLGPAPTQN
jgi:hypothetical protein